MEGLHLYLWAMALGALLVTPALADDDPFRNAAPPVSVAPKVAPRPESPMPVVVPQPPPSHFSADYAARVRQAAASQQVGVPDGIVFREESTPAEYRNYLGAWGPGTWSNGLRYLVVVQAVDSNGNADVIRSWGDSPEGYFKSGWEKLRGTLGGGRLVIDFLYTGKNKPQGVQGRHSFTLAADNRLYGTSSFGPQIDLSRLQ